MQAVLLENLHCVIVLLDKIVVNNGKIILFQNLRIVLCCVVLCCVVLCCVVLCCVVLCCA